MALKSIQTNLLELKKKKNPVECIPLCYFAVLNKMLKMRVSESIDENRFEIKAGDR